MGESVEIGGNYGGVAEIALRCERKRDGFQKKIPNFGGGARRVYAPIM